MHYTGIFLGGQIRAFHPLKLLPPDLSHTDELAWKEGTMSVKCGCTVLSLQHANTYDVPIVYITCDQI